jgi:DNA-binding LytR/AlgR family response regulator
MMENHFRKPYNQVETTRQKIVFILAFGLFIFLFLFLFKPFGLATIISRSQLALSLGFGLVTIFMLIIFKFLIEPVVIRKTLTFGKSILWCLLIASSIGVANYFFAVIIFPQIFIFKYLLLAIWTAILVAIIPVSIGYIVTFNRIYRTALKEASISPDEILWESEVVIRGGNPRNEYKCNPKCIVYLCSNDNYITIFTLNGETINKTHLRGTLKAAELELRNNTSFFRCHKCFIVNTQYADHITGNIQNMKIKLKIQGLEVPVSRQKASEAARKFR